MPQFNAGAVKTAKITFTNTKAKATDYNAWLYMGADFVPMAGASFSLSAGQSKDVLFTVTMPGAAGTYPVHVGAFSNDVLIPPLRRATEDVQIVLPRLISYSSLGHIEIIGVDGKGFSGLCPSEPEVGDPSRITPCAVLSSPTVVPNLWPSAVSLTWQNASLPRYNPDGFIAWWCRYQYKAAFPVSDPYTDAPQCYTRMDLPTFQGGAPYTTQFYHWYGGYWRPGIYDALFQWGLLEAGQVFPYIVATFRIRNMVQCTTWGQFVD